MTALVLLANLFSWPVIHVCLSAAFLHLPARWFEQDTWLTLPRRWEQNGRLYRDRLAIRRWKALLPDGAPWLGGFGKKKLCSHDFAYLTRFLEETRRAEMAHACMLCCAPVFFLWNPPWACCVMTLYALAANLPCMAAQRYNRIVLSRLAAMASHSPVRQ
jgi:glycosyl-4,4'-diaponeurosporenoate acyltransferase